MFRTKEPMRPTEPRRVLTYLYIYIYVFVFVFIHIIICAYIYRERERWRQRERERETERSRITGQSVYARPKLERGAFAEDSMPCIGTLYVGLGGRASYV